MDVATALLALGVGSGGSPSRFIHLVGAELVDAFLSQPDLAVSTRAKYRQTLPGLKVELAKAPVTGAAAPS